MPTPSGSLEALIQEEIAHHGPMTFRDFMDRALYHPQWGYYASGRAQIGRKGDFFTSVSVGPLFGRLLARQFAEMWEQLGRPKPFTLVEQGAHRGDLVRDVLGGLRDFAPDCFHALEVRIVEPSAVLAEPQRDAVAAFPGKVSWHVGLEDLTPFTGVHFSNELLDAFPVHVVHWNGAEWIERRVTWDGGAFVWIDGPLSCPALVDALELLPPVPEGYVTEVNLAAPDWLGALASRLYRGFVLAIDYGYPREEYYRPERTTGTLSAYADHRREPNPLARPGELDLTAHVEFTSVIESAARHGLALAGFQDQHHFIVGLGSLHFADQAELTAAAQKEIREFQTLMHPNLMGRSFQALCFSKGVDAGGGLAGFDFGRGVPAC